MLLSMPNTYSQIYVQIVFAVKGRECFIKESFREELQKYISGLRLFLLKWKLKIVLPFMNIFSTINMSLVLYCQEQK